MLFRNHRLRKTWLDKCLESPDSGDHSTGDIEIWSPAPLTYLMNTLKLTEIDKVSLSDIQNLRTVC